MDIKESGVDQQTNNESGKLIDHTPRKFDSEGKEML